MSFGQHRPKDACPPRTRAKGFWGLLPSKSHRHPTRTADRYVPRSVWPGGSAVPLPDARSRVRPMVELDNLACRCLFSRFRVLDPLGGRAAQRIRLRPESKLAGGCTEPPAREFPCLDKRVWFEWKRK